MKRASLPAVAAAQAICLPVAGLTCASWPFVAEAAGAGVDGVLDVHADAETKEPRVALDDAIASVDDTAFTTLKAGGHASPLNVGF